MVEPYDSLRCLIHWVSLGIFGWSMEPTSDQPLFLERPSRVPCVSILNCVYICFWGGKFGSLNGSLENEMPWFCRCSNDRCHCLPTIKLLSTSPLLVASIYSFESNPTLTNHPCTSSPPPKKAPSLCNKSPGGTTLADAWWTFTLAESTSGFLGGWGTTWSFTSPTRRTQKTSEVQLRWKKMVSQKWVNEVVKYMFSTNQC